MNHLPLQLRICMNFLWKWNITSHNFIVPFSYLNMTSTIFIILNSFHTCNNEIPNIPLWSNIVWYEIVEQKTLPNKESKIEHSFHSLHLRWTHCNDGTSISPFVVWICTLPQICSIWTNTYTIHWYWENKVSIDHERFWSLNIYTEIIRY